MTLDRWHRVGLIVTVVLALGLRLWGSGYDLPYIYHPDEPVTARIAVHHLKDLDLSPHFFIGAQPISTWSRWHTCHTTWREG